MTTAAFNAQREQLEDALRDAANDLLAHMGYPAALKVPARLAGDTAIYVGTPADVERMARGPSTRTEG